MGSCIMSTFWVSWNQWEGHVCTQKIFFMWKNGHKMVLLKGLYQIFFDRKPDLPVEF